jgi:hypothetical protein
MDGVLTTVPFGHKVLEGKHKQVGSNAFTTTHIQDYSFGKSDAHGSFYP